ncbi:MAG: fold metallo-hydrolase [Chloroflexi bacterium]|nr:fold metallo-hydrolase [Chloroflexota bacterium]
MHPEKPTEGSVTETSAAGEIRAISLHGRMYQVSCYLVRAGTGFVLIDTGLATRRAELRRALEAAGCGPGDLRLIVLTHGDADHAGNAAHLRDAYGVPVAAHRAEWPAIEQGNMRLSRGEMTFVRRTISSLLFRVAGLRKPDRFRPDLALEDGDDLAGHGLDARVLHLPGHSRGSIGILTAVGDLFCGDLLTSLGEPEPNSLVDDPADLQASVERVRDLETRTVYPGHGGPFRMEEVGRQAR